jgi:transposase
MMEIMWTPAPKLEVSEEQVRTLRAWAAAGNTPQKVVSRSQIVLLAHEGMANAAIARRLNTSRPTVILWRERFEKGGPQALTEDAPGRGRKRRILAEKVQALVEATLHSKPNHATHWSVRSMARSQGVSKSSVQRIWEAHGLQPHRTRTFKVSRDPRFVEKLRDVVGLYLNPPEKALVLCVDEKSQIQALQRSQPGLPMKRGRCGTMTHDYKRHGTTTLFAALDALQGTVIGDCAPRHRHQEFLRFLRRIDRETPAGLDLHLIVDNYSTHKHQRVKAWVKRHPRLHLHFTPTGCSWLNLIECWFGKLTRQRLRRGDFRSVRELIAAIRDYLAHTNQQPTPFIWTAPAERILAKVARCKPISETVH